MAGERMLAACQSVSGRIAASLVIEIDQERLGGLQHLLLADTRGTARAGRRGEHGCLATLIHSHPCVGSTDRRNLRGCLVGRLVEGAS